MIKDGMGALMSRLPTHHAIKILPKYFEEVLRNRKTFEIRKNDRDFRSGDSVTLHEYVGPPLEYTGRSVRGTVGYVYEGDGMAHGYCAFSFIADSREIEINGKSAI